MSAGGSGESDAGKTHIVIGCYIFKEEKAQAKLLFIHHTKLNLWLPPGGHIEENETPDDACLREAQEEVGLSIELLSQNPIPMEGNIVRNCAVPFHVNVHSVKDHDHCCLFYVCRALNPEQLAINAESKEYMWVAENEITQERIPPDVRAIARLAFGEYQKWKANIKKK